MSLISALSDEQLLDGLNRLVNKETETTVDILLWLSEVEVRGIYKELGHASLFDFCRRRLSYSEPATSRRIRSARCVRKFPEVEEMLRDRRLSLTTVSMLAGIINEENKSELLEAASGKSCSEVEVVVAGYKPKPVVRERIKPVVVKKAIQRSASSEELPLFEAPASKPAPVKPEPLEERYELSFSVSKECMEKYRKAVAVSSRKSPQGVSLEGLFEDLLDEYLSRKAPDRKVRKKKAHSTTKSKNKRHIPADVRREVFKRDNNQCTYVSPDGVRCCSTWDLEIDHITPVFLGGTSEPENLRLLCRTHNQHLAKKELGADFVERRIPMK